MSAGLTFDLGSPDLVGETVGRIVLNVEHMDLSGVAGAYTVDAEIIWEFYGP